MSAIAFAIHVNGDAREVAAGTTVATLLDAMDLAGRRVAVEINREIVPRSEHATRVLAAGDRLEIVHALGGG
jgi:sulfur carrier protein